MHTALKSENCFTHMCVYPCSMLIYVCSHMFCWGRGKHTDITSVFFKTVVIAFPQQLQIVQLVTSESAKMRTLCPQGEPHPAYVSDLGITSNWKEENPEQWFMQAWNWLSCLWGRVKLAEFPQEDTERPTNHAIRRQHCTEYLWEVRDLLSVGRS